MKNITDFCDKKGINANMKEAFMAYVRSDYASKYYLSNGETTKLVVGKMNDEELEEAWKSFVNDFKKYLTS